MTGDTRQGLTEAQVRALAGVVEGTRPKPRWDMATRLMRKGMLRVEAHIRPGGGVAPWVYALTDAGREVLSRAQEAGR